MSADTPLRKAIEKRNSRAPGGAYRRLMAVSSQPDLSELIRLINLYPQASRFEFKEKIRKC